MTKLSFLVAALPIAWGPIALGSDHGLVFGMATPTNIKGGWSFDIGLMGRAGVRSPDDSTRTPSRCMVPLQE